MMKLAEALLLRSEYQQKIENLQSRMLSNLKVQEGEKPHEDPAALLQEAFELNDNLCALVKQINKRNNAQTLPDGRTLAEALADRDCIMKKRNLLAALAGKAAESDYRLARAEIKMQVVLPVGELQQQLDELSRSFRELDTLIQSVNWTTDL